MHDVIVFEGDAYPTNPTIQLTINQGDKSLNGSLGRATYKEPMHLWDKVSGNLADFTTHFSFAINSQNNTDYADGFAFFLVSNGSTLQNGSQGGNLGLLSEDQTLKYSNYSFVAVEFDTFHNPNLDTIDFDHVGIDLNNMKSLNTATWSWSDILNGGKAEAWVNYNSSSKNLSLVLVDANDKNYHRNSTSLYSILDLRDYLSEWVTFGFSGATGSLFETHSIYSWDFSSSLQENKVYQTIAPVASMPSPSTGRSSKKWRVVVLAVGGGALVFIGFIFGLVWFCCWMKRNKTEKGGHATYVDAKIQGAIGSRKFSFEELVVATSKFSDEGLLGEGGFGRFYLQEECEQCVLHRDIKSSNVLLDSNFNAKLGDFGLARLVNHGQHSQTTVLLGTEGYVAPEYRETSKATKESDMYSFGIVALEIACGKKASGEIERNGKKCRMRLVDWVWEHYGLEDICAATDPRLGHDYDKEQMEHLIVVGLACAQPNHEDRPSIRQALDMLNFKAPLPVLPREMPVPKHIATLLASVHSKAGSLFMASGASPNTTSSKSTASSTFSNTTLGVTQATN
ncbi:hypothetical protein Ddye_001398 [Dipteronia dyeriana]|uniref:non-specific serine/threonine protein kinase n=1 Tax=Dipteronia dyeriana TaxID=168575 RepID=A0AAD9XNJ2_9ROSI|nr:hypothetical protein Ddye_001398 [Dipteronia dyeriana]